MASSTDNVSLEKELVQSVVVDSPASSLSEIGRPSGPATWGTGKKLFHTVVPCVSAFVVTFSTSVTVPATALIAADFEVTTTESTLVLTLYTMGIGLGTLFIAPLSEVLGRKWLYFMTAVFLLAFNAGAGASQTYGALLACRLLAGTLGSAGVAIGAGTIVDVWGVGRNNGLAGVFYILGPFLGPTLGPLAGGYILHHHDNDWRWTQWLLVIMAAPVVIGTLCMSETSRRRPAPSPQSNPEAQLQPSTAGVDDAQSPPKPSPIRIVLKATTRATRLLFTDPIVFSLTIYLSYAYAMVFSYFSSNAYILTRYYGFNARQVGLSLLSPLIGYLLAAFLFIFFESTLYARAANRARDEAISQGRDGDTAAPDPEHRLYAAMVGSVFLPAGLFWYAWSAKQDGNWAVLVASGIPFGLGAFSLFVSSITYMVTIFHSHSAASALAANGLLRYSVGAVFPLFTLPMYQRLGVQWAGSLFAFLSLLLLPIPWVLFKFGPKLRGRSKFARGPG